MEGSGRGVLAVLGILAALTAFGSSYQILEGPQNATVLKGSEARFNCTVSSGWKLIMWALKGTVVLSITPREPIITNDRFTSASYDLDGNFISEMVIHDVQPSDSGPVRCSLQNSDLAGSAFLSVQVVGSLHILGDSLVVTEDEPCNITCQALGWTPAPDMTWELGVPASHSSYSSFLEPGDLPRAVSVLALTPQGDGTLTCVAKLKGLQASKSVTVNLTVVQPPPDSIDKPSTSLPTWAIVLLAVSLSLLLILIIVLIIIFCCCCVSEKEKKESSYQNEIRKSPHVKMNTGAHETKPNGGNENYGYSLEEPRSADHFAVPPKSSELSIPAQRGSRPPQKEVEKHRSNPASRPQVSFNVTGPQKVRNATLV
ncbi:immunoglobulin superfamily member 5 isoform X1 [Fukomys damarensis]|uniref:immunoglobulin superfamily member 5 isoform X1 n=1 Tax=Fukomys damarensis TaxID=885580 RepID=UPI0005401D93|nr:immunoglobulin superfamily member 5 isoform X1 [Fukomys damarensis]